MDKMLIFVIAIIAAVVLVFATFFVILPSMQGGDEEEGGGDEGDGTILTATYTVYVLGENGTNSGWRWSLTSITVSNNTRVTFHIINNSTAAHGFMIREFPPSQSSIYPNSIVDIFFTVNQVGTFSYYSTLLGDEEMVGTIEATP